MLRAALRFRVRLLAVVAGAILASSSAHASAEGEHLLMKTGNDALTTCTATFDSDVMAASICIAWMQGVRDSHYMTMAINGYQQPMWCTPDNVTNQQHRDIFVKYLRENPERRHGLPAILYLQALMAAFPCVAGKTE